jgi:DNA-binding response OmpR family regulator
MGQRPGLGEMEPHEHRSFTLSPSQSQVADFQQYRMFAAQQRELARTERLPNVRRKLQASAERWELLAQSHEHFATSAARSHSPQLPHSAPPAERSRQSEVVIDPARSLVLNFGHQTVAADGQVIPMTGREREVLALLASNHGHVVSKSALVRHLYLRREQTDSRIIDVFICKLRKKLARACGDRDYIETVRGFGYRLNKA